MPRKLLWNTHRPMTINPSPRKQGFFIYHTAPNPIGQLENKKEHVFPQGKQGFFIYHTAPNPASPPIGQLENQKEHVFQLIGTYLRALRQPQIHAANPRNNGLTSKCHVARGTEDLNTPAKGKTNWFLPKV
ncbi:hypothetical protein CEXT_535581 [Caerostris extrusa]|uniref:Uncharacterized protein n=1 Tax=Caerostris extrusa TaxID=172846 RepID=A0AAV4XDR7_CAEEX|nr:hypothetical protein CEXT_535581 [Caerostris extrusa]